MDVDQIQKVNELAREMLKHRIASSMDEAVKQAEEVLSKKKDASKIREEVEKDEEKRREMTSEVRRLKAKIEEQAKKIEELEGKLKHANSKITELELRKTTPFIEKERAEPQTRLVKEEKKPHPKSGGYNPEDVSIEKMFYSGPKD